jgi:hypothetical protein
LLVLIGLGDKIEERALPARGKTLEEVLSDWKKTIGKIKERKKMR